MILAAIGIMALFGVLFTLPQYFQAVLQLNAQGSGLRLLPVIAGMLVGAVPADRIAERIGPKLTVAVGFAVLTGAMAAGVMMTAGSSDRFIAAWTFAAGGGVGLALATAASAALVELSGERSGIGSALLQAVQKLGVPFGAAILGSALNSAYQQSLRLAAVPAAAAGAAEKSVFAGLAVAQQLGSASLLQSVRTAFVAGMDGALRVSAGIAAAGIVLALAFLPLRTRAAAASARRPA